MFLCIPLVYGCPSKLTQEGHDTRICPRCHNGNVEPVKVKKWFEFCYIPLIPLGTKHIFYCSVCRWSSPIDASFQPQPIHGGGTKQPQHHQQVDPNYVPPPGRGYDVGYAQHPQGGVVQQGGKVQ